MQNQSFRALVVRERDNGRFTHSVETRAVEELPAGELLVRVHYSSLNYKDALSASGHKGVTKRYPHTPGIDAAGVVEASEQSDFAAGDEVIVHGRDLGMNTPGGFGQVIRVPAEWARRLPAGLTLAESMAYGSAGFTAAYCILRLEENGLTPGRGDVLVTGATGGVGSFAVALLAKIGYRAVAVTGKADAAAWLKDLGAADVIGRDDVLPGPNRGLAKVRWAGAIDTVGGKYLDAALRCTQQRGAVTCCGMIDSTELPTSIFPFILRGVCLLGIDAAETPAGRREQIWSKLAGDWKLPHLNRFTTDCTLDDLTTHIDTMLAGKLRGRIRVRLTD